LLAQPQPVTAQLPQVVRPFISDFGEPVAPPTTQFAEPVATPRRTPTLALHPPQQTEPEYDLVTVTPQGYEVRHID